MVAALIVLFTVRVEGVVLAYGVLEPVNIFPVRSAESGIIETVLVHTGDRVRAGQFVMRMDALPLRNELARLEGEQRMQDLGRRKATAAAPVQLREEKDRVVQADAKLSASRAQLLARMVEQRLGTNIDSLIRAYRPGTHVLLDQAVSEVSSAAAAQRLSESMVSRLALDHYDRSIESAKHDQLAAEIASLQERLKRTDLTSPADGIVLTENVERLKGASTAGGATILEIADTTAWRVVLSLREEDVHSIRIGDQTRVEIQALRREERRLIRGRVVFIGEEPNDTRADDGARGLPVQSSGYFRVIVELASSPPSTAMPLHLRRGYAVKGNIVTHDARVLERSLSYWRGAAVW